VLCQAPLSNISFIYGKRVMPLAMTEPGSALTIVLIVVFVAALALGLLSMLVSKGRTDKREERSGEPRPLPPAGRYGPQAIIDIIGEGIETTLTGIAGCIVFIFDGSIVLFKRIFRIDR